MAAGFQVNPDDLDTFSDNLDALVAQLDESVTVLNGVHFDPLVFGIVGQFFSIAARIKVDKAKDVIGQYRDAITSARDNTKETAKTYRETESGISDTFKG
ncbi:WXG100 family type VII secretion target [Saccharothrix coeruleofusca]|uniref:Excreted virulence factor EspC (Type VII ESX diderm) n=1 Tax=Saccharothrix coeruleofusca TaxID=33919 RepID=A0A918AQE5_9PSEU|nr:hypothetical protein [Saccharothrix coeruleofusca]MBP2335098.1 translation elongation factor EF-1beta [Saccharothrix coeruleofusca]GGP69114.1 hypothetical protein GCM10010185_47660 [Saccharothrix coeruleofusca]